VLPLVVRLVEHAPERTVFTRFIPPASVDEAKGQWRAYYEKWPRVTRQNLDPDLLDLVPPLARFAPPAPVFDKFVYSAFANPALHTFLRARRITTLVVTGSETDVCVLASVLAAVDLGYRVIVARDAVCSSSDATHDALIKLYTDRFDRQIELAETEDIISAWPAIATA
jgi:nicotinamidase-related amidase